MDQGQIGVRSSEFDGGFIHTPQLIDQAPSGILPLLIRMNNPSRKSPGR
jgi:hypothetical protein